MNVSIIGTGYVGLVSGACLAARGHHVVCVDVDTTKIDIINSGKAPIHEEGLTELLTRYRGTSLTATADLRKAVLESDVTLIAVGTPARDGRIDLAYIAEAARQVGEALREKSSYHVLAVKSTVIPGTTDGTVRDAAEKASGKRAGADFGLGMNPEFLTEGTAVHDFMNPDRIVIGGIDERSRDVLAQLYESFKDCPIVRTNNKTAEMIKYASNSLLATMISFSNELAALSSAIGDIDIAEVMKGVHLCTYLTSRLDDGRRVKAPIASFLEAGCGFGGSCLPKDVTALVAQGADLNVPMPMLRSVLEINAAQPDRLVELVRKHIPDLAGKRVAVLGIAFKPDTDDTRESPAFPVLRKLAALGAQLTAYDPIARPVGHDALKSVTLADSVEGAVKDADAVVLITRWPEFNELASLLRRLGRRPLVVDGRRVLNPDDFDLYEGIGWRKLGDDDK